MSPKLSLTFVLTLVLTMSLAFVIVHATTNRPGPSDGQPMRPGQTGDRGNAGKTAPFALPVPSSSARLAALAATRGTSTAGAHDCCKDK